MSDEKSNDGIKVEACEDAYRLFYFSIHDHQGRPFFKLYTDGTIEVQYPADTVGELADMFWKLVSERIKADQLMKMLNYVALENAARNMNLLEANNKLMNQNRALRHALVLIGQIDYITPTKDGINLIIKKGDRSYGCTPNEAIDITDLDPSIPKADNDH